MNILKQIFVYFKWIALSLLIGLSYMWMRIIPTEESSNTLLYLLSVFYRHGVLYIGGLIGLIIAFIFILLDNFYLKNKLKHTKNPIAIRITFFLGIMSMVILIHYILEKVIDII